MIKEIISSFADENVAGVGMFSSLDAITLTGLCITLVVSSDLMLRITLMLYLINGLSIKF
jgi:hypothetical protein